LAIHVRLIEINRNPDRRQLRQFGLCSLIALWLASWVWAGALPAWSLLATGTVGVGLGVLAIVAPGALRLPFLVLSIATAPIGLLVAELVLVVIFLGAFVPMSLIFRILGRDALRLRFDRDRASYWQPKQQPKSIESYFQQS